MGKCFILIEIGVTIIGIIGASTSEDPLSALLHPKTIINKNKQLKIQEKLFIYIYSLFII